MASFGKRQPASPSPILQARAVGLTSPPLTLPSPPSEEPDVDRFMWMTFWLILACAGIGTLQLIPVIGLLFLLLGPLIGVAVHIYCLAITAQAVTGRIPRSFIILPLAFYGAGLWIGIESDIQASRWASGRQWLEVSGHVPASTKLLSFDGWNMIEGGKLPDPRGVFRPENAGFEMAWLALHPNLGRRSNERLVFHSMAKRNCYHGGRDTWRIGDRCFKGEYIDRPETFLVLGDNALKSTESGTRNHDWGTVFFGTHPLVLHEPAGKTVVAELHGAVIRKSNYVLFPMAFCGGASSARKWSCEWSIVARMRDQPIGFLPSVTGSAKESATLLMEALRRVRS
jgi:hypothetical protein